MKTLLRLFILFALGFITATASAQTTWYLNQAPPYGASWNTSSGGVLIYWSQNPTSPLGASPAALSSQDTYDTNKYNLRTPAATLAAPNATFGGGALILNQSTLQLKSVITTIGNLSTAPTWGAISNSDADVVGESDLILNVTQFTINGEARLNSVNSSNRTLALNITTLLGSGNLLFGTSASTFTFSGINATSYTGNMVLGTGSSLTFSSNPSDWISGGGLILNTGSVVALNRNLTFTSLTIGGVNVNPGTYSYAQLNSTYDAFFTNTGSGSITVSAIPEPATTGLLIFAGLALMLRRRNRT